MLFIRWPTCRHDNSSNLRACTGSRVSHRPSDASRKTSSGRAATMPNWRFMLDRYVSGSYLSAATLPIAPAPGSEHASQTTRVWAGGGRNRRSV